MLAVAHAVALSLPAQQQPTPPQPQPPAPQQPAPQQPTPQQPQAQDPQAAPEPGRRVEAQDNQLLFDEAVVQMEGKNVRSVVFLQLDEADTAGRRLRPVDSAAADSYVRSLQSRVGQKFESRKVSADCASLWHDRRVVVEAYAREDGGEVALTFKIVREVEVYAGVEFVGLAALDRFTVDGLLGLYPDRQVTATEAEAMRKVLMARYRRDGYAHVSVTSVPAPIEEADLGAAGPTPTSRPSRVLRFVIDEGPKVTIGTVSFLGNTSFAADAFLGTFGVDDYLIRDSRIESDPAHGLINGGPYSQEVLEEDLDKLRIFYRSRGFLDATVDLAAVQFSPDRSRVDLSFVVVEGPRYRVRSLRVEHVQGNFEPLTTAPLYDAIEIEKELKVVPGEFYDHERLQRDVLAIQDFYGRRGHPAWNYPGMTASDSGCQVLPPLETYGTGPEVDLVIRIVEGVPKKLRDVVIRGNRFSKDHVIRRRIRVMPGDTVDMVQVKRSLRAIEQTRYFQDPISLIGPRLQLEPVDEQPEYVDIGLDVTDGPTGQLRWGIGVSTGQGVQAQITFNKSNFDLWKPPSSINPITAIGEVLDNKAFHGGGQNLNMLLAPGDRYSQFQITWSDPDIFRQYIDTWELRLSGRRMIRRLPDGYTSDILGAEVGLSHNVTEHFNVGVAFREESAEVDDLAPDATSLAFDAEGQTELRGLRLSARYRDYDDFLRPTSGFEVSLAGEVVGGPLGGEESLTKLTHSAHLYTPLAENEMGHRTVLHVEQFFGVANEFGGSDDVFLTERFYLGAYNLRGFDYRRAGPKQFGRPVGGEATWTATAEVFFPLVATRLEGEVRDRELLRWVLFTDFGLLGLGLDDSSFTELRAASGIGVRIEIPFLEIPIALDLGWPWKYEDSDDRRQLYFSISR
jgi:outer membrane protein insertion porin family